MGVPGKVRGGVKTAPHGGLKPKTNGTAPAAEEIKLPVTASVAEGCIKCKLCVKNCKFLQANCETPKDLAEKMLKGEYRNHPEIAFKCQLCGLCNIKCPKKLDIAGMFSEIRFKIAEENIPLPGNMKYVKNSQDFVLSDKFRLVKPAPSGNTTELFFPGCGLASYSPELTNKVWRWLNENEQDCGLLLSCCGTPSLNATDKARFESTVKEIKDIMGQFGAQSLVCACPDCALSFREHSDIKTVSIYEILAKKWNPKGKKPAGSWVMHEPCKAKELPDFRDSVRKLLEKCDADWKEAPGCGESAVCCGMGGLVAYTDMAWQEGISKARACELAGDFFTYCASCRQALKPHGQDGIHVLDMLFTDDLEAAKKVDAPALADERSNQLRCKALLDEPYIPAAECERPVAGNDASALGDNILTENPDLKKAVLALAKAAKAQAEVTAKTCETVAALADLITAMIGGQPGVALSAASVKPVLPEACEDKGPDAICGDAAQSVLSSDKDDKAAAEATAETAAKAADSEKPAEAPAAKQLSLKLLIADDVRAKMEERAIRDEEVCQVIEEALKTGLQMKDPEDEGRCIAKLKIADVYYYADYKPEGDGYRINDAYWHKTTVTGW